MFDKYNILIVVPARGGSKGITLKNIQPLQGVPLVAITGQLVEQLPFKNRAVVSTDNQEIAACAEKAGLAVPFVRPPELSGDRIGDWDVLMHALRKTEEIDKTVYHIVVMLQPTSPFRKVKHVVDCIDKLITEGCDAVWTVSETDSKAHPVKQLTITGDRLDYYDKQGASIIARQQLSKVYHRNGAAYAFTRECLVDQKTIKGNKTSALIIEDVMVNIDTPYDLKLTELILQNHLFNT